MRENALCALVAGTASAAMAWLGLYGFAWNDYEVEAKPAFDVLTHGHVLEFLRLVPAFDHFGKGRLEHVGSELSVSQDAEQEPPQLFPMLDIQGRDDGGPALAHAPIPRLPRRDRPQLEIGDPL